MCHLSQYYIQLWTIFDKVHFHKLSSRTVQNMRKWSIRILTEDFKFMPDKKYKKKTGNALLFNDSTSLQSYRMSKLN